MGSDIAAAVPGVVVEGCAGGVLSFDPDHFGTEGHLREAEPRERPEGGPPCQDSSAHSDLRLPIFCCQRGVSLGVGNRIIGRIDRSGQVIIHPNAAPAEQGPLIWDWGRMGLWRVGAGLVVFASV